MKNFTFKICLLVIWISVISLSCHRNDDSPGNEKRFLTNQIIGFNGYKKAFETEPSEVLNYYQDLFKLFMVDEKSFQHTIDFLHEDGAGLETKKLNLEKIIESDGYELVAIDADDPAYSYVRLLVNKKINSQFFVEKKKVNSLLNLKNYRENYMKFCAEFKK